MLDPDVLDHQDGSQHAADLLRMSAAQNHHGAARFCAGEFEQRRIPQPAGKAWFHGAQHPLTGDTRAGNNRLGIDQNIQPAAPATDDAAREKASARAHGLPAGITSLPPRVG